MLTLPRIEHIDVVFSDIKLLNVQTPNYFDVPFCCPPTHPDLKTGILSRDSALLLLRLYPPVLWSDQKYCILGRRVLHLVSPHILGKDKIKVGFMPVATLEEVKTLMSIESLLTQITFATTERGLGIFETSQKMDQAVVNAVAPLFCGSLEAIAKLVSCSVSAIAKASAALKKC